jgi:hypothetical protein
MRVTARRTLLPPIVALTAPATASAIKCRNGGSSMFADRGRNHRECVIDHARAVNLRHQKDMSH